MQTKARRLEYAWRVVRTARKLVCLGPRGKEGRQRARGPGREEDEATWGAEAEAQGENFGFGCKSDENPCKCGQEKGQELALSVQLLPSLQHCLLIRSVISPLLPESLS